MSLSSFYKKPQPKGYSTSRYYIEDTTASSPSYFNIQQFPSAVGGGKSVIIIKGNGDNLRLNSTIDVEIVDANGDNVFVEMTNYIDRFNNYYITFEVYDISATGPATVYLVGEALYDIPAFERQISKLEGELQILVDELRVLQDQYNTANNNLSNSTTVLSNLRSLIDEDSAAITKVRGWLQAAINLLNGIPDSLIPRSAKDEIEEFKAQIQSFSNRLADNNFRLPAFVDKAVEEQKVVDRILVQVQEAANRVGRQQQVINDLEPTPLPKPLDSQRPAYNVRWSGDIMLLPFERNNADLYFDKPPSVGIVQVITPERALVTSATSGSTYLIFTSSKDDFTIQTSNFQGYDRDFSTSTEILDPRLLSIIANPNQNPTTTNTINSSLRKSISEIENGYLKEQSSRFGTVVTSVSGAIKKDFLGATFSFFSSESCPKQLYPTIPANLSVSGSVSEQWRTYEATVVEVVSNSQMLIDKTLSLVVLDSNQSTKNYTSTFNYKRATNFTASIAYLPSDGAFVTSSTVSQSYLETTFSDLRPISGEVYRIKTYYKRGIATGEYKLIYDHVVSPVEYLTDATFPNQTSYAKHDSDYRLIGHFTTEEILDHYWEFYVETPNSIYTAPTPNIVSSSLHESMPVAADYSQSWLATSKFNQNYNANQVYTLSCLIAMDPDTEVEFYMNSEPISTNTYIASSYPRAFSKTKNKEMTRYTNPLNRFGKYIGKIVNDSNKVKYYGRVEFDFITDSDGLGRPLFRTNIIDRANITGSAHIAEVSIKPLTMNGFSPNLVQFAIPFNNEIDAILALSQSLDFKMEYFDYTGKQSEYITTINDLVVNLKAEIPSNTCQAETITFYSPGNYENY